MSDDEQAKKMEQLLLRPVGPEWVHLRESLSKFVGAKNTAAMRALVNQAVGQVIGELQEAGRLELLLAEDFTKKLRPHEVKQEKHRLLQMFAVHGRPGLFTENTPFLCDDCGINRTCAHAFDLYNEGTEGFCLAEK